MLTAIVHAHLARTSGVNLPGLKEWWLYQLMGLRNALAWGLEGRGLPPPPDWELVGSPLGKFRANALLERAVNVAMEHEEADPRLPNFPFQSQSLNHTGTTMMRFGFL